MTRDNRPDDLMRYYHGFFLQDPVSNNAFSFAQRRNRRLFVPPLVCGTPADLEPGDRPVFGEMRHGKECVCSGLRQWIYWRDRGRDIFFFDNHNHAFAFWVWAVKNKRIRPGGTLVHVDQHKDTRPADKVPEPGFWQTMTLSEVCSYVNTVLNVGNFIPPALETGLFQEVVMVDRSAAFDLPLQGERILDLDLDIFAPEMEYISHDKKIRLIRREIAASPLVTVATSPYFLDQQRAVELIGELFDFL